MKIDALLKAGSLKGVVRLGLGNTQLRHKAFKFIEQKLTDSFVRHKPPNRPTQVQRDQVTYIMALLYSLDRSLQRGVISKHVLQRIFDTMIDNVFFSGEIRQRAVERLGHNPPLFILISPGKRCNLHCIGCYACSDAHAAAKLDNKTFDRILTEKEELWGSYFTVISGGEPFLWEDEGIDLIDMAQRHSKNYFLVYTNGTLIDEERAKRLAEVGNITPAISVEGFEAETDARRGKGVHKRILRAMEALRKVGVPFGISITATRHNAELIMSDEFFDYYFNEQGATYGWIFQYMPIGRRHTLDLLVTPEQRLRMLRRTREIVKQRRIFLADFWNSGPVSSGCISAGRPHGYFHIDWDGDITPCAFVPYTTANIYEIYRNGGTLDDALRCPLFQHIRRWQDEYGYAQTSAEKVGNWFCPCVIRDHYEVFLKAARETNAKPIDSEAEAALADPEYHRGLIEYGRQVDELTREIWEKEYIEPERQTQTVVSV